MGDSRWELGDDYADGVAADDTDVYVTGDFRGAGLILRTIGGANAITLVPADSSNEEIHLFSYNAAWSSGGRRQFQVLRRASHTILHLMQRIFFLQADMKDPQASPPGPARSAHPQTGTFLFHLILKQTALLIGLILFPALTVEMNTADP